MWLNRSGLGVVLLILGASVATIAQPNKSPNKKSIHRILGTWKIQKILSGKTEVTKNPTSGQWIEFRPDGHYVNKMVSTDSGSYRLNENQSVLYLESQVNSDPAKHEAKKVVEWAITFQDGMMTMQQNHNKEKKGHADIMKYVYTRIDESSKAQNN